jgi:hypothetical protein
MVSSLLISSPLQFFTPLDLNYQGIQIYLI